MVFLVAQVCHLHLVDRAHQDFPFIVLVVRDALIHVHYVRQPPALTAVLHHPAQAVLKLSQPALDQVLLEGLDQVYFPPRDQVSPRPPGPGRRTQESARDLLDHLGIHLQELLAPLRESDATQYHLNRKQILSLLNIDNYSL